MSDKYVCMRVCTKSFLNTTTNSLCVRAHLAKKADSDSDSEKGMNLYRHTEKYMYMHTFIFMVAYVNIVPFNSEQALAQLLLKTTKTWNYYCYGFTNTYNIAYSLVLH